ncbi:MAG: hypothetical protein WAV95_19405 [Azonexus sp.]
MLQPEMLATLPMNPDFVDNVILETAGSGISATKALVRPTAAARSFDKGVAEASVALRNPPDNQFTQLGHCCRWGTFELRQQCARLLTGTNLNAVLSEPNI